MAPKNPTSATLEKSVKNYPPLAKDRAKRLEVFRQIMKAKADLKRRIVQPEKIDWKSEAEAFKTLLYSIQKEKRLEELAGEIEKHLEELAATTEQCLEVYRQTMKAKANLKRRMVQPEKIDWKSEAEALGKLSHRIYSIQKESEGKIEKRLEELAEVRNITSTFNSFSIDSSQKKA
ncbi:hypothetical protein QN277_006094 [Acacia crassicarpa]|uniref:Uncharacterized protein n=1 Tax=Acacia crassicarpa TaxID=499986 RepID=A0AAE1IXL3_9FABA|nr:hypothetical protein QN277_006094 [Acacia crassicarpa]